MPTEVLGPTGALVLAVFLIGALGKVIQVLWASHLAADAEDRQQRDTFQALLKDSIDGNKRIAAAWEARNRREEAQSRSGDGK